MICGSWGSKSRLAKAAGAEPAGQMRDEKVHAVVARSTFPSQNIQNTSASDHSWKLQCRKSARRCGAKHISKSKCAKHHQVPDLFWKLRCRKSARRCGAKHISKWKCTKHTILGPLLEVEMSKKCTPLWREAHFQVKMLKTLGVRTLHFWRFGCRKSARRCGAKHISKSKCAKKNMFAPLLEVQMSLHYTTLHYTYTTLHNTTTTTTLHYTELHSATLHYTKLHSTTLHYLPLHFTTLHCTTLHSTTLQLQLHSTTLHYTKLHYTTLHSTTLPYTTLHYFDYTSLHDTKLHSTTLQLQLQLHNYTPLHSTTLNYTTLHYITLHYIPLHSTTLHYITLHCITLNDTAPQIDR